VEFLVEFELDVPPETPEAEVAEREREEAAAAARLAEDGHLLRVWNGPGAVVALYRADSDAQLRCLLDSSPLREWMEITITALAPHPSDPGR
jgi:muconolactone delta-isomerase